MVLVSAGQWSVACVQDYKEANASREAAFQAAEVALKQGASETELDERTHVALHSLDR